MARADKAAGKRLLKTKPAFDDSKKPSLKVGDSIQNLVAGMGTDRDKRSHSFYGFPRPMTRFELENMYRASWLAKRIVNVVADDMTREWRKLVLPDADDNPQIEQLEKAEKDLKVQHRFNEAYRWARLYGGSIMILGLDDIKKPEDWAKPYDVDKQPRKGCLRYIHVIDRWRCAPNGIRIGDLSDPNYGLPEVYLLADTADSQGKGSVVIHNTRLLRFNGEKLPYYSWLSNGWWDDSVLQHVFDTLSDYDTMSAAMAAMMFEANIDVVQTEGLTDLLSTKDGEAKLAKRYQLGAMMKSFNRMLVLDSNEEYQKKTNSFSGLDAIWQKSMVNVSGAAEIPMTRLFGDSPGGLSTNGDGDLETYYGMIGSKQNTEMKPQLERFDKIFVASILGSVPDGYEFEFNPLWVMSDAERATMEYAFAQRDQIYLNTGVVSEGLVASELKARGTYRSMTADDVKMAEELAQSNDDHEQTTKEQTVEQTQVNIDNAKKETDNADGGKANK